MPDNRPIEDAAEILRHVAAGMKNQTIAPEDAAALDRRLAAIETLLCDIRRLRAELLTAMPGAPFISPWI